MGTEAFDTKGPEIINLDNIKEWYARQAQSFLLSLKNQKTPLDWNNIQKSLNVGYDKKWLLAKDKYVLMVNGTEVATLKQDKNHDNIISFLYEVVKQTGIEALSGKEPAADKVKEKCNEIIINMQLDELEKGVTKATLLAEMQARLNRHTATDPRGKSDDINENEHIKDRVATNVDIQKAQNDTLQSLIKQLNKQLKQDLQTTQLQLEKEHLEHLLSELQNIQKQLEANPSEPEIGRLRNDLQRVIGEINTLSQKKNAEIKTPKKFREKSDGGSGSSEKKRGGPRAEGYDDVYFNAPSWSNEAERVAVGSGETRAVKPHASNPEIIVGADGTLRELKDLNKVSLDELIGMWNKLSEEDKSHDQANTIRTALLYRVIKEATLWPKLGSDGKVIGSSMETLLPKLWGIDKFWTLVKEVIVDSSFVSTMNSEVTRNLQLAKAVRANERANAKQTYLTNYFALTDETEKSAIILNAFVKNLAPIMYEKYQDPMLNNPLALKLIFEPYKDESNVLDYQSAAADIEWVCGTLWNGSNDILDVAKNEGAGGLVRLGLTKMVENGYISIDTAAKIARGTDAVMNIAQTWFAVAWVVHGVMTVWNFGRALFGFDMKKDAAGKDVRDWSKVTKSAKNALGRGLGGYYGMQVLQNPSSWKDIPLVSSLYPAFDKEWRAKQKIEEQVNSGILISTTAASEVMDNVFGQKSIEELKSDGVLLVNARTDEVSMDVDKFISLAESYPQLKNLDKSEKRAYVSALNSKLVNEYQLTWKKLDELAKTGKKFTDVLAYLEAQNALIQKFKWVLEWAGLWSPQFAEDLQTKTGPEKEALEAKLAFAAQQMNKLNNKDDIWNKYVTNEMTHITGASEKALLVWSLKKAMDQTDIAGTNGQSFLTSKLKDYLLTDSLSDYFKAVAVVFSNTETFGASPKPSPLYLNPPTAAPWVPPPPDFVSFIHDATIGNATVWGTDYISSPTLGTDVSNYIDTSRTLSSPITKKWEEIVGEL